MRVLLVKLTSMGDAIHLLPAITDLVDAHPQVTIDWMIEESFTEIPAWHPAVATTIPVSTRRWRKLSWRVIKEFVGFVKTLRQQQYDVVIDAQGLIKSALFARLARINRTGVRIGFSADSIKEKPAARLYQRKISVPRNEHAIRRLRSLVSQAFEYQIDQAKIDYRLRFASNHSETKQVCLFHGTTWDSKHLPESMWRQLVDLASGDGYQVLLPWGNETERQRAERLAAHGATAKVLPRSDLNQLKETVSAASGAIAVDTGLGHLAAALGIPTVSIYGSTNAALTGAIGANQTHMQTEFSCSPCLLKKCDKLDQHDADPPCYATLEASNIWRTLKTAMERSN